MAAGDRKRVLAVERDARPHGALAVDMVVLVDEDAVAAAEPAAERVQLLAQLGVAVGPRVAGEPAFARPGLIGVGVVAERRRDHGPRAREQLLGVAGDLRPPRREAHRREETALLPLADVALGLLVVRGRRGADRVQAELVA